MAKSNEPIWWSLFSAGGVVAAFLVPVLILITGIAWPLGLLPGDALQFAKMQALLSHPLTRVFCFVLISLPLFHWAHRFRFTLIDVGLKSIHTLVAVLCYGAAIAGTIAAAVILWR
ncbi:MAG: fumarate reductase subunit D [Acidobacteria bacterium]|nr:MAG: fumarate reductase subunit D [Acidobacteriota bacterium]